MLEQQAVATGRVCKCRLYHMPLCLQYQLHPDGVILSNIPTYIEHT